MPDPQSPFDFYVDLYVDVLSSPCPSSDLDCERCFTRDIATVRSRVSKEGISFLTKVLPRLGKAFDQALLGNVLAVPRDFSLESQRRNWPAFMQTNFEHVLSPKGVLREDACLWCIKHLRQVFYMAYKIDFPYSDAENQKVLDAFRACEVELDDEFEPDEQYVRVFKRARSIITSIFEGFDPSDILPHHGPGATASGAKGEAKWSDFTTLYDALHQKYPYYEYFVVGQARELFDRLVWYKGMRRAPYGVAKVSLVPKDSRGPRLISAEPTEYMWLQEGLGKQIMRHLQSFYLTRGKLNFTDQSINQMHALTSSISGEMCTIDLKDASDRVSLGLVKYLFRDTYLLPYLEALRTHATILPGGEVLDLKKFAPMGSALCFPIESVIFWAILHSLCCSGRADGENGVSLPLNKPNDRVFVYGDDIIVPNDMYDQAVAILEAASLVVNQEKSCHTGFFRESCGVDAFAGNNVTPHKIRHQWTGERLDSTCYASYVNSINELRKRGYVEAASNLRRKIETIYGPVPYGTERSGFPSIVLDDVEECERNNFLTHRFRWNGDYRRWEFRVRCLVSKTSKTGLDGWSRLTRNLCQGTGERPDLYTRSRLTKTKYEWRLVG